MAKQKREKRKKNEMKARTIQKLQLGMTAPTDLDLNDNELAGEEMFDLGEGERELARAGGRNLREVVNDADGLSESEDEASAEVPEESDDEVLSSDEERELRTQMLEGALDSLYDDYKERMSERDAKWKVKQQRLKDRNFDSWHGIREGDESDDGVDKGYRDQMVRRMPRRGDADSEDEESEGEGGWDVVAAQKAKLDNDSSSDSDSDDDEAPKKAKKAAVKIRPDARAPAQPKRLLTTLTPDDTRAQMSKNAQVWFDQGVFKDVGDLAALDGDDESEEDEEEDDDMEESDEAGDSDVEMESDLSSTLGDENEDEDDFEVVAQDKDDEPEWDVDDEDQDEVLQKQIKGEFGER